MPVNSRNEVLKTVKERSYLNKDFNAFYNDLKSYANTYFPTKIRDFSENSLGGLLLEIPSFIGDVQSFYLDHAFLENSPETAIEPRNIERHLKDAGVPIVGAAPSVLEGTFFIKIPKEPNSNPPTLMTSALPVIQQGTILTSTNGVLFELVEDLDFSEKDPEGNLKAHQEIGDLDLNNQPSSFILSLTGLCVSGRTTSESFGVGSFQRFKTFTLSNENVFEIVSVVDDEGTEYFEVDFLTQDTVYKSIPNHNSDKDSVKDTIQLLPAPYRFIKSMSLNNRLTTLTFGGGNAVTLDNDVIPDPSEFALPLYGKTNFSRIKINPANLLSTSTLGIIKPNSTITVTYRFGGGLSHNIPPNATSLSTLKMVFPKSPGSNIVSFVRNSTEATNNKESSGGEDAPTLDQLKSLIPAYRSSQDRIVSNPDLLARMYKMPANFGRIFRAASISNSENPLATTLYVICRNSKNELILAPDSLKRNIVTFLNQQRLISDAIDILDVPVINIQVEFKLIVDPQQSNKQLILQNVLNKLKNYFNIKNFEIGQPISYENIRNILFNNQGVIGIQELRIKNVTGKIGTRTYSDIQFDIDSNITKGFIVGPQGSMFELKYKDNDLIGTAI